MISTRIGEETEGRGGCYKPCPSHGVVSILDHIIKKRGCFLWNLSQLIVPAALQERHCAHTHFTDAKAEA